MFFKSWFDSESVFFHFGVFGINFVTLQFDTVSETDLSRKVYTAPYMTSVNIRRTYVLYYLGTCQLEGRTKQNLTSQQSRTNWIKIKLHILQNLRRKNVPFFTLLVNWSIILMIRVELWNTVRCSRRGKILSLH